VLGNTKEVSRNQIFLAIKLIKPKQDLLLKYLKIQLKILKRLKTFSDSLNFKKFLQKLLEWDDGPSVTHLDKELAEAM